MYARRRGDFASGVLASYIYRDHLRPYSVRQQMEEIEFVLKHDGWYLAHLHEGKWCFSGDKSVQLSIFFNQSHTKYRIVADDCRYKVYGGDLFIECTVEDCKMYERAGILSIPDDLQYNKCYVNTIYSKVKICLRENDINIEWDVFIEFFDEHCRNKYGDAWNVE